MSILRFILAIVFFLVPSTISAQESDKDFLTRLLQESLAGEWRDVEITGFKGAFTNEATIEEIQVSDDQGIWLTLKDIVLEWDRSALLRGRIDIAQMSASSIDFDRAPNPPERGLPAPEAKGFKLPKLPVSVSIQTISAKKIRLGASLLGEEILLTLQASAELGGEVGAARLLAERIDDARGEFGIDASFDQSTDFLKINARLVEDKNGVVARLLEIPDRPSVTLELSGEGPLDEFSSDLHLATAGQDRLTGNVTINAAAQSADGGTVARAFAAEVEGDVTALFAQQYRNFFGDSVQLKIIGQREAAGNLDITKLDLKTQEFLLTGEVSLNSDAWPTKANLTARLSGEGPVLLPLQGPETKVAQADLAVKFDVTKSDLWKAKLRIDDLSRDLFELGQLNLSANGTLDGEIGSVGQVNAQIDLNADGLNVLDPTLAQALGQNLSGKLSLAFSEGSPLKLTNIDISTDTLTLFGLADVDDLQSGFQSVFDLRMLTPDISNFSKLLGQQISGGADLKLNGSAGLGGEFDLNLTGSAEDLTLGSKIPDLLLAGKTRVNLDILRDETGISIPAATIDTQEISLTGSGRFATEDSLASYNVSLRDFAIIEPSLSGPMDITGTAEQNAEGWFVDLNASGPIGGRADISGLATGPTAKLDFDASLPNIQPLVRVVNGPLSLSGTLAASEIGWLIDTTLQGPHKLSGNVGGRLTGQDPQFQFSASMPSIAPIIPEIEGAFRLDGTAQKTGINWLLETQLSGPSNAQTRIDGTVSEKGNLDLKALGFVPLGLSEPFLRPRSLQGDAQFDLSVNGPARLSSLSGTISTRKARLSIPSRQLAINDITSDVSLANGRAQVDLTGELSTGGTIATTGTINLSTDLNAALNLNFRNVRFNDPELYKTKSSAALKINGPLLSDALITGEITIDEAEILVPSSGITTFGEVPQITHLGAIKPVLRSLARAGRTADGSKSKGGSQKLAYGLNVSVLAPSRIFVRGRGIEAELGGSVRLSGSTNKTISSGRFDLIRGRLDILEKRFALDEGNVQLQGDFDPFIRFAARTNTDNGTASVIIEGQASSPEVRFESSPEAPQDEVLSQIFFRRDISQLSAFQALQLANAIATLAGRGGEGIASRLRRKFDLDDLDITTDDEGNTAVRAGKYISDNVYTDVTSSTDGESEISINIDLSPSVTARGTLGTDGESKLGIFFEKDY